MKYFHYKPDDGFLADVVPFYWDGAYRLFYLHDYRDPAGQGEGVPWRQIVTKDFIHFEEKGDMIPRGKENEQDLYIFTGCVLRAEDRFHIFYTGHNPHLISQGKPQEAVMHAVSDDLENWQKCGDELFFAPAGYEPHDWRDPYVFYDEGDGRYHMVLAARKQTGPVLRRGCTAHCVSDDLIHWSAVEPVWIPELYFTHECPDLFRMGDWYYLIYSEFSGEFRTHYVKSRSLYGPWEAPEDDVFDTRAFYAGKTAGDGERRYIFGWNPTRTGGKDNGAFQWGGCLVAHEVYSDAAGDLHVRMPASYPAAFSEKMPLVFQEGSHAAAEAAGWHLCNPSGYAEIVSDRELPAVCLIAMEAEITPATRELGLRIRYDRERDASYALSYRPDTRRLECQNMPRTCQDPLDAAGLWRILPEDTGNTVHFVLLMDHDVATLYVNDCVAMSLRLCQGEDRSGLAFYLLHGEVHVRNLAACTIPGKEL